MLKTVNLYYTLMTSLPHLVFFDRAERLPISMVRLRERLRMLNQEDAALVELCQNFLQWQRHPLERTDREMIGHYEKMAQAITDPVLMEMVHFRTDQRSILAALRRRHLGMGPPRHQEQWGVGYRVRVIEKNWHEPYFGLLSIFPWIREAKQLMENDQTLELEHFILNMTWINVTKLAGEDLFSLKALLAYLFKWDIIDLWLSYQGQAAQKRFMGLVEESVHEHIIV